VCARRECACRASVFLDLWRGLGCAADRLNDLAMCADPTTAVGWSELTEAYKAWVHVVHDGMAECQTAHLEASVREWAAGALSSDMQPLVAWTRTGTEATVTTARQTLKAAVTKAVEEYVRAVVVNTAPSDEAQRASVIQMVGRTLVYGRVQGWRDDASQAGDHQDAVAAWAAGVDKLRTLSVSDLAAVLKTTTSTETAETVVAALGKWADTVAIVLPALRAVAAVPAVWDQVVPLYRRTLCFEGL
jgi:hypothetical protein